MRVYKACLVLLKDEPGAILRLGPVLAVLKSWDPKLLCALHGTKALKFS